MNRILVAALIGVVFICPGALPANAKSKLQQKESHYTTADLPLLALKQFKKLRKQHGVVVLDTRSGDDFLKAFIPGSINVGFKGPFDTFLKQVVPDKNQKLLIVAEEQDRTAVVERLAELGYTGAIGILDGGIDRWKEREPVDAVTNLSAGRFGERSDPGHIVDVRTVKEFDKGHIDNAMNIPLTDFINFGNTLEKDNKPLYVHCQSGYRSAVAVSILRAKGFKNVCNIQGGYKALKDEIKEN
ncbi:rhodanese-like domain-containing protein [Sphingobacterium detergens]|uniref:Rhodanese-related sulfurtransferase n=1 Tax=Sphingobacterium detergens TaxID=1145106 RepID=A0A420B6N9_SPHD1|nr:rhodanese-like domain-containing protein [Sphingobacterium detergens]RKE52342.1 rhodanese-related sulfurtransferase [Sphingobacterium detergens]